MGLIKETTISDSTTACSPFWTHLWVLVVWHGSFSFSGFSLRSFSAAGCWFPKLCNRLPSWLCKHTFSGLFCGQEQWIDPGREVGERKGQGVNRSVCVGSHGTAFAGEATSRPYWGFVTQMAWPGSSVYILFVQIFLRTEGSIKKTLFFMFLKTNVVSVASSMWLMLSSKAQLCPMMTSSKKRQKKLRLRMRLDSGWELSSV